MWKNVLGEMAFDLFKLVLACVVLGGYGWFVSLCMAGDRERQQRLAKAKERRRRP